MMPEQLLSFLAFFIVITGRLIVYAIIARIVMSWLQVTGKSANFGRLNEVLTDITEPFINLARKVPHRAGMFDFAPLIAIIGIDLLVEIASTLLLRLV